MLFVRFISIISIIFIVNFRTFADNRIDEIKQYISQIKSIAVEFNQNDSRGNVSRGMLIIDKPYKFRCNYYKPFPIVIIGNNNYISVYDYDMSHLSRMKASSNMFYFLLADDIDFENKFTILSVRKDSNYCRVKLKTIVSDTVSDIVFNVKTKHIKEMKVYDGDNIINISFGKTYKITDVAKNLFILQNRDIYGPPDRLNKQELERMFTIVQS